MERDIIDFGHGKIDALKDGNLIYLSFYGEYTDNDAKELTRYLEKFFAEINAPTIRINDGSNMTSEQYKLTPQGIDFLMSWANKVKEKRPGSVSYIIGNTDLIFGMSRMYEIRTANDLMPIQVLKSVDDLPGEIKIRISGKIPGKQQITKQGQTTILPNQSYMARKN